MIARLTKEAVLYAVMLLGNVYYFDHYARHLKGYLIFGGGMVFAVGLLSWTLAGLYVRISSGDSSESAAPDFE